MPSSFGRREGWPRLRRRALVLTAGPADVAQCRSNTLEECPLCLAVWFSIAVWLNFGP